jgi:transducin (beta)-like 1
LDEDFSFLQPLDLITKDVYELRQIIKEKRKNLQKDGDKDKDKELDLEHEGERRRIRDKERHEREKEREKEKDKERTEKDMEREKQPEDHTDREMVTDQEDKVNVKHKDNGVFVGKFTLILNFICLDLSLAIPYTN